MTASNRIEINRANAQHSTGPITEAGKQRSSLNALRHGLTGETVVMPSEDLATYERHLKSFTDEYQPKGASESNLVQALADASWRLNRVVALESSLLASASRTREDADAIAAALETRFKALNNLSMHSQRLSRQFERTLVQLRELQKCRREQREQELSGLVDILEMYKAKGETYDPSQDGFVFSAAEIDDFMRTQSRKNRIQQALHHRRTAVASGN